MSSWCVFARDPINDQQLADELAMWFAKHRNGLRLFREGATVCELTWAADALIAVSSLEPLWLIRLFCVRFELHARRRTFDGAGNWQLRIIGPAGELPDGFPVTPVGEMTSVMLLGKHVGNGEYKDTPNRYRRSRLRYPLTDDSPPDSVCHLMIQSFQGVPRNDGTDVDAGAHLSCWTDLRATVDGTHPISSNIE